MATKELKQIFTKRRKVIIGKWNSWIAESYPAETTRFLLKIKNPITNPVGSTTASEIEKLADALFEDKILQVKESLKTILQIRAVQNFTPSKAVGFVFQFKEILSEELKSQLKGKALQVELRNMDRLVDSVGLMAFDLYMEWREKLFTLRIGEVKKRSFMAKQTNPDDDFLFIPTVPKGAE